MISEIQQAVEQLSQAIKDNFEDGERFKVRESDGVIIDIRKSGKPAKPVDLINHFLEQNQIVALADGNHLNTEKDKWNAENFKNFKNAGYFFPELSPNFEEEYMTVSNLLKENSPDAEESLKQLKLSNSKRYLLQENIVNQPEPGSIHIMNTINFFTDSKNQLNQYILKDENENVPNLNKEDESKFRSLIEENTAVNTEGYDIEHIQKYANLIKSTFNEDRTKKTVREDLYLRNNPEGKGDGTIIVEGGIFGIIEDTYCCSFALEEKTGKYNIISDSKEAAPKSLTKKQRNSLNELFFGEIAAQISDFSKANKALQEGKFFASFNTVHEANLNGTEVKFLDYREYVEAREKGIEGEELSNIRTNRDGAYADDIIEIYNKNPDIGIVIERGSNHMTKTTSDRNLTQKLNERAGQDVVTVVLQQDDKYDGVVYTLRQFVNEKDKDGNYLNRIPPYVQIISEDQVYDGKEYFRQVAKEHDRREETNEYTDGIEALITQQEAEEAAQDKSKGGRGRN
jgi:hypothetical protein